MGVPTVSLSWRMSAVTPCLASSSAMQLPSIFQCPGTKLRLILRWAHLVRRFAAFRDCFWVRCVGVEGPGGCLTIREDENVYVVMYWYGFLNWSCRRNETFMSSSGEKTPPPVWELSLEPSMYMLTELAWLLQCIASELSWGRNPTFSQWLCHLRVRSRMLSVQRSFFLLRVRRVWCSFARVRFGTLFFLVKITSSDFSGLTPSPQTAVNMVRVDKAVSIRLQRVCGNLPCSRVTTSSV